MSGHLASISEKYIPVNNYSEPIVKNVPKVLGFLANPADWRSGGPFDRVYA
jgi:hypothetical protein